jgi:hypothetical protein
MQFLSDESLRLILLNAKHQRIQERQAARTVMPLNSVQEDARDSLQSDTLLTPKA